jgi:hypothetical protein
MTDQTSLRRSLLALAMLAVLLLSTGAAWLLAHSSGLRVHAAAEIVQAIHDKGLASYWGHEERTEWMLVYANEKLIGWRVLQQRPAEEGYAGGEIEVAVQAGHVAAQAMGNWQLSLDAHAGNYLANMAGVNGKRTTQIRLGEGKVAIRQQTPTGAAQAVSPAPDNYLPEGTMMLAALLVAQRGADAQFVQIDDAQPNQGGEVRFVPARMRYQGKLKQKDGGEVYEVLLTYADTSQKLHLTADGRIASITGENEVVQASTEEEVAKHFGQVPGQLPHWRTTAPASTPSAVPASWVEELFGWL